MTVTEGKAACRSEFSKINMKNKQTLEKAINISKSKLPKNKISSGVSLIGLELEN